MGRDRFALGACVAAVTVCLLEACSGVAIGSLILSDGGVVIASDANMGSVVDGGGSSVDSSATDEASQGGGGDTGAGTDSGAPRCNPTSAFGPAIALTSLNTPYDDGTPRLSPDELTVYFSSDRPGGAGGSDIWEAHRATRTTDFTAPAPIITANTDGDEDDPSVSADGLTLYVDVYGGPWGGAYNIAVSTRSSAAVDFGPLVLANIAFPDGGGPIANPFLAADNTTLYLDSPRLGDWDIYISTPTGSSSAPQLLAGPINTAGKENEPALTPDQLTLYFSSDRPGGLGGEDLYVATRASTSDPFGTPVNLTSLNTPEVDLASWISADGCVLYFTRGVSGTEGINYDMYSATRGM